MTAEAQRRLQRVLKHLHQVRLMHARSQRDDLVLSSLASAGGTLETLRDLGAITHEELQEWNRHFLVAVGVEPPQPPPPITEEFADESGVEGARSTATVQAVRVVDTPPPPPPRQVDWTQFRRLLPGSNEEQPFARGRLRILCVEEYANGLVVQWLFIKPVDEVDVTSHLPGLDAQLDALPESEREAHSSDLQLSARLNESPLDALTVSDDIGTSYEPGSGGASGDLLGLHGRSTFMPAPPRNATRLAVKADEAHFSLPLV